MKGRFFRLAASFAFVLTTTAESPIPSAGAGDLEPGCANVQVAELLRDFDTVEVAVAAGKSIPGDRGVAYRKTTDYIVACTKRGARITVRPITEHAFTELPVLAEVVPDKTGENRYNDYHYNADRRAYLKRAAAALDTLPAIGTRDTGSDPLGALLAASRDLRPESKAIVLLVCNGWQQTRELNVFVYRTDPARYAPVAIQKLARHHAVPDLTGVRVVVTGITSGAAGINVPDSHLDGLCVFWKTVVETAHGSIHQGDCVPNLRGVAR